MTVKNCLHSHPGPGTRVGPVAVLHMRGAECTPALTTSGPAAGGRLSETGEEVAAAGHAPSRQSPTPPENVAPFAKAILKKSLHLASKWPSWHHWCAGV